MSNVKSEAKNHAKNEYIGGDNIPPGGVDEDGTGGPADGTDLMKWGSPDLRKPHELPNVGVSRFFGEGVEE